MRFESDIWHYNIVQGLLYLMSPDVLTLDLEEVSDILFLHVSHVSFLLCTGQDSLEEDKLKRCTCKLCTCGILM